MATMPEVPFSELLNKPKATMEKLSHSRSRSILLRRRDAADVVVRERERDEERTEIVNMAARFLTALMEDETTKPTAVRLARRVLPWIRFLPDSEAEAFLAELAETLRATIDFDNPAPVLQLVIAWRGTAEVYADPEMLAVAGEGSQPQGDPKATDR